MRLRLAWLIAAAAIVAAISGTFVGRAGAQDTTAVLRGLTGVHVAVIGVTPQLEAAGLSQDQIQRDIELRLRQAGVRVLTQTELRAAPGNPALMGRVSVLKATADQPAKVFQASLALVEGATLTRSAGREATVITYHDDIYGVSGAAGMRDALRDLADKFANEFLKHNPKR